MIIEFIINFEIFSIEWDVQKRMGNQVKLGNGQSILASETRACWAGMKRPGGAGTSVSDGGKLTGESR